MEYTAEFFQCEIRPCDAGCDAALTLRRHPRLRHTSRLAKLSSFAARFPIAAHFTKFLALFRNVELKEEAFAAFADDAPSSSSSSSPAQSGAASAQQQQEGAEAAPRRGARGPASQRADKLRSEADTPQRAREAIDRGLQLFGAGQYREAIDMFQLSLEVGARSAPCNAAAAAGRANRGRQGRCGGGAVAGVRRGKLACGVDQRTKHCPPGCPPPRAAQLPGSGVMRLSGSVREYSCASEGEENAALYNMACCWARLGEKQARGAPVGRWPGV